ncbi:MAG: PepSY-associated TM helix domain-containing protein [Pseudomonadota bacterium]
MIFWTHLSAGVAAGLFILIMSATGILLAYERQIVAAAEMRHMKSLATTRSNDTPASVTNAPLALPDLFDATLAMGGERPVTHLKIHNHPHTPVIVLSGRRTIGYLDRRGNAVDEPAAGTNAFFSRVRGLHRWQTLTGKKSDIGKTITGLANLVFFSSR